MSLLHSVQEEVLQRLGRVGIAARHAVEAILSGQHRSINRGLSVEFAGHRPYQSGDDVRYLDWRVFARTDRYHIQYYQEETRLRATLVVDCSGSMAYGRRVRKLDYARQLAAALALIMVRQGDAVGLALADSKLRRHLPPGSTMAHGLSLLSELETVPAGGHTSLGPALDDLAEHLTRRGLVIVISDGIDDPESLVRSLRHLRHRRQDVRFYQILDPAEKSFPFQGYYEFIGLEGGEQARIDTDRARGYYERAFKAHSQALAGGCHGAGIHFETITTDQDLALVLAHSLISLSAHQLRRGGA